MALLQDSEPLDVLSERRAALVAEIHCLLCTEYFLLAASIAPTASTYFSRSSWLPVLDTSNFSNLIRKCRVFHNKGTVEGGAWDSRRAGPRGGVAKGVAGGARIIMPTKNSSRSTLAPSRSSAMICSRLGGCG
eukprot:scaffold21620_cov65-Phaeocystis_antarctica.AAC.7